MFRNSVVVFSIVQFFFLLLCIWFSVKLLLKSPGLSRHSPGLLAEVDERHLLINLSSGVSQALTGSDVTFITTSCLFCHPKPLTFTMSSDDDLWPSQEVHCIKSSSFSAEQHDNSTELLTNVCCSSDHWYLVRELLYLVMFKYDLIIFIMFLLKD